MLSVLVCVMPYFVATNRIPRRGYDIAVRSYHLLLVLLARRHEHVIIGFHLGGCLKLISQHILDTDCLLYTSPSPRDKRQSRMPSSA